MFTFQVFVSDDMKSFLFQYAKDNLAKVTVYLENESAEKMIREVKFSYSSLVASVGGLLGLFLGFSLISGIEIVYLSFQGIVEFIKSKLFQTY